MGAGAAASLECTCCHHQASVTAGTVLHGTRTPLTLWLWGAYLVATHTPRIAAAQLRRQLGLPRYETAWLMLQKLRRRWWRASASHSRTRSRSTSSSSAAWKRARTARASAARSRSARARSRYAGGARDGFGCEWSPTPLPDRSAASSRRASSAGRSCGPMPGPATPACGDSASAPSAEPARPTRGGR